MIIDEGESCCLRGLRIHKEYEDCPNKLTSSLLNTVAEWAKPYGANKFVAATDNLRPSFKVTGNVVCLGLNARKPVIGVPLGQIFLLVYLRTLLL